MGEVIEKKYFCDICKEDVNELEKSSGKTQVIFKTEQTEGRSCKPYLSMEDIDFCKKCISKVLDGNYIFAHGAMGHNEYYFKE